MFTGIIEATACIRSKTETSLTLDRPEAFDDCCIGCSIAVAGVCLSVTAFDAVSLTFGVIPETWERTKLGSLTAGDHVNLERALRADGRLDGHIVQGHVEGVGTVLSIVRTGEDVRHTLTVPAQSVHFVIPKGSIALDGVSLTVADMQGDHCTVALIPHTLEVTTLGILREGDPVNIETDITGRYIYNMIKQYTTP